MTVLASLPEEFKPLITALDAVGEDNISFEKVKGILLNDNDRWKDAKKYEDAFSIQRGKAISRQLKPRKETRENFLWNLLFLPRTRTFRERLSKTKDTRE
jgi:hypothetical protein